MNEALIELCRHLITLASVNPQDRHENDYPYGEQRISDFVYDWLVKHGVSVKRQHVMPGRDNIFAMATGGDTSKTLLLCAHMDTVDVKGMTVSPFEPTVCEGKIFGRGSCDDKGPLAALMVAFCQRVEKGNLPCNLALLASCGEEYNLDGARYFAGHLPGPISAVLIAEPTELKVITAHKGIARLHLQTNGKSVHSATPDLGSNAIYPLARATGIVESYAKRLKDRTAHPQLGHETLSLTMIHGGQQINIIPDQCSAELDWRILPGRSPQACRDELAEEIRSQLDEPIELELLGHYEPMFTNPEHPMVQSLLKASENIAGQRDVQAVAYATDAGAFAHMNIPTPVFGPGSAAQAHTPNEFIEIAQLEKGLAAYTQYLNGDWGI